MAEKLAEVMVQDPLIPYLCNVEAAPVTDKSRVKELLAKQVCGTVRWRETMEYMLADGVDTFVEIGPGKALSGFFKKTAPEIKTYHIDTAADFHSVASALKGETA